MTWRIDLNCDMGEGGPQDEALMEYVTSVNIACGVHAGSEAFMRRTIELAGERNLGLGAHPGAADPAGMGRREIPIGPQEAYRLVFDQTRALAAVADACGQRLRHVKPHGTLYNLAARDTVVASAVARAVRDADDQLILFALAGGCLTRAGETAGLAVAQEAFADRAYQSDGTLVPRSRRDAMIDDPGQSVRQAVRLVKEQKLVTADGVELAIHADTLCVHGDGPSALAILKSLRDVFAREGIEVARVQRP